MSRLLERLALGVSAVVAVAALAACGQTIEGRAKPIGDGTVDAVGTSTTKTATAKPSSSSRSSTSKTASPTAPDQGGSIDFDAAVGDCVSLGGASNDPKIEKVACGSKTSNYKVIGKVPNTSECVSDRDSYYAEKRNGIQTGALCLDIDWVVGDCMDVGGEDPKRIDCTETAVEGVKVVSIEQNTTAVASCGTGSGFTYKERKFVVCVSDM
ncbi:LppU family putative lipoprotein [Nocardia goodfellowii]|uniref:LppU protein n=1 Tax=Nocardia goodfellowii TaxID=882446 RepID=A0ABS4Q9K9_9NOCA|nr:hypothetical protein [Nocardia goodfellowii]MBP2188263.1 hypothetical protein [Nocardia goodfellowii]